MQSNFSNLTKEEQDGHFMDKARNAVLRKVELQIEEKTKQQQSKEEMEQREAALKEQMQKEKEQAAREAKEREEKHPISGLVKQDGCMYALVTVPNVQMLRWCEYTG
jgi:hypothetical protein